MRTKKVLVAMAGALALPLVWTGVAWGHGYTTAPPSRAYNCSIGAVGDCGDIQYEPQSTEGPKGFPEAGPADGQICSAGISRFAQLDDMRGGTWPTSQLTSGGTYTFKWTLTAAHATTSFRYFVTKDGWDPTAPLTRAQLDLTPFLTVPYNGQQPPTSVAHTGTLPSGKSGRHMIVGVWDIADTGNAFYQCADVTF
ncbi:lytic polysaccharide monooxygenase auxiliary activity family 9 protein [Amycolatopsis saalfeldensis]|uniref:Chitin-binding protein n=1 Tax=Amycolatopsis saalfeldensis TaxID=394193 RepID=A0A1H8YB35_9PSEU|nr:lytic polysaccharide monooxygenase [Amycolatopsis saalfeldensis]SEP49312.1 chitin-binding protein [Amycolatopsis saalfeldensis]